MLKRFHLLILAVTAMISAHAEGAANNPASAPKTAAEIPIADFVKEALFSDITLSPDGKHIAMIVPQPDRSNFAVIDVDTLKPAYAMKMRQDEYLVSATWVSNERLILSLGQRFAGFEATSATGELIGVNFDGSKNKYLFGYRGATQVGTRITAGTAQAAFGFLASNRLISDRYVLISTRGFDQGVDSNSKWCRMDVYTGATKCETGLPGKGRLVGALLDEKNTIRYVTLEDLDGHETVFYREPEGEWRVVFDAPGEELSLLGWTGKGAEVYAAHGRKTGPDALVKFEPVSKNLTETYVPKFASIGGVVYKPGTLNPIAVRMMEGRGGFKPLAKGPEYDLLVKAAQSFPGEIAGPVEFSRDGSRALVQVDSDVSPSHYYLYEQATGKLRTLGFARPWIDADLMSPTEILQIKTKDGLTLEAYLTLPADASAENPAPLILVPHGGPIGPRDFWRFDEETQILASRGYAVLKVNYRGSGGYGSAFLKAGYRQWGKAMQTDLTESVDFVTKRKDVDSKRLAVLGASYGGYAALMAGALEPERYQAVISYVGVTDLKLMYTRGDIEDSVFGVSFLRRTLGEENLEDISPVNLASKIKAPVMIIHGAKDNRVPIKHAEKMRDALIDAGNAPEWLVEAKEGHGFVDENNKRTMYEKLFAFLDKHVKNAK